MPVSVAAGITCCMKGTGCFTELHLAQHMCNMQLKSENVDL